MNKKLTDSWRRSRTHKFDLIQNVEISKLNNLQKTTKYKKTGNIVFKKSVQIKFMEKIKIPTFKPEFDHTRNIC